jgi:ATP-binding cassette subfamily F protein uup
MTARHAEIEDLLLDALDRWERIEARAKGDQP